MKSVSASSLGLILAVLVLLFAGTVGYEAYSFLEKSPATLSGAEPVEIIYEVQPGKTFSAIAHELAERGLVRDALYLRIYAKALHQENKVKIGEYALNTGMRPIDIMAVLKSGKSIEHAFTVSEGLNIFEIAELYKESNLGSEEDFLKMVRDREFIHELFKTHTDFSEPPSLEGYLFPETYMLTKYTDGKTLVSTMVKKFFTTWHEVSAHANADQLKSTQLKPNEIVTLASIVEKETGAPNERPLIASVFYNRMGLKMRLQTDPTILYGKALKMGKYEINITRADIHEPTSYNTYVIAGLPPGPIANAGKEALEATLHPQTSKFLYFVSHNDGTHQFSENLKDHESAVKKFQLDPKAREGKSWRDLKKTKK